MWDDVIIGKGNRGNSAMKVTSIEGDHSISENSVSYWISDVYLSLGVTIFKATDEGCRLSQMINEKAPLVEINSYLADVVLIHADRKRLRKAIGSEVMRAYESGRNDKTYEIRAVLGM